MNGLAIGLFDPRQDSTPTAEAGTNFKYLGDRSTQGSDVLDTWGVSVDPWARAALAAQGSGEGVRRGA